MRLSWANISKVDAGWSSPVARQAHNLKVVGSNPTPATKISPPGFQSGGFFVSCRAQPGADASGTGKSPPMPAARSEIVESRRDCRQRDNDLRCIIHQRSDLGFCVPESVPSRFAAGVKSTAPGRRPGRENIGGPTVVMRQYRVGDCVVPGL